METEDTRSLKITLGVYLVIFAMKLAVYFMSGVMSLFAEALHTLSDIFISGFLLAASVYSRKKADATHMFGHGRAQNVAALVAATLFISFTSYELYREAIPRLFEREPAVYQNIPLVFGVLVVSMLIAAAPLIKLQAQKERGAAAKAQLMELFNDELGLLAALLGTLFITMGWSIADPLAAILVATLIAYNAVRLFIENASFLLGRSPGKEYLAQIESLARSVPGVLDVHELRAEYIAPDIVHTGMHIEVQSGLTVDEGNRIAAEVYRRVHERVDVGYCFIHVDARKTSQANGAANS